MWRELDQLGTLIALVLLTVTLGWLTVELARRTRHWNGLSKSLTILVGTLDLIFLWLLLVTLHWMPWVRWTRLGLIVGIYLATLNVLHHLRKLPPQTWRGHWHDATTS